MPRVSTPTTLPTAIMIPRPWPRGLKDWLPCFPTTDGEALDQWREIRAGLAMTANSVDVAKLDTQIRAFEFEAALQTLTELKGTPGGRHANKTPQ